MSDEYVDYDEWYEERFRDWEEPEASFQAYCDGQVQAYYERQHYDAISAYMEAGGMIPAGAWEAKGP